MTGIILTAKTLNDGAQILAQRDPDLARIWFDLGTPPLWERAAGFATLIYIILEQQVSLASARAAYDRLTATLHDITPLNFLELDDTQLKSIGFSRQKIVYGRILALAIQNGILDLESLVGMADQEICDRLTAIKGIGRWTAEIYILMALLHADIFPASDLALMVAMQQVKNLPSRPTVEVMENIAEAWHPWRAVATRLLWFRYLSG